MSSNDIGLSSAVDVDGQRALEHLRLAQELIDRLDRPEIGARLQEVIDAMDGSAGDRASGGPPSS